MGPRQLSPQPAFDSEGARRALMNPSADAVIIELAEQATLEEGLGFDRCQVAIVTGTAGAEALVRPGIDETATVLKAIRAPVDVVVPGGVAILKRDDPETEAMAEHCKGEVTLFGRADWSRGSESLPAGSVEPLLAAAAAARALGVPAPIVDQFLNNFDG